MLDPLDIENRPLLSLLSNKRRKAFFALSVELFILHFWRLFFWILLFSGLWMLDVPAFFGRIAVILAPIVFLAGIAYVFLRDIRRLRLPDERDLDKALEDCSKLTRGHISILEDQLANPKTKETRTLWDHAQHEILHSLKRLKTPHIRSLLVKKDPRALRFITVLVFISGLMVSGPLWQEKIWNGLLPIKPSLVLSQGKTTNLWIKPPEYTQLGQAHIVGTSSGENPFPIPEGSEIRIRLHSALGTWLPPTVFHGDTSQTMDYMGDGIYGYEAIIDQGNSIAVSQAYIPRAEWFYHYIPDLPPEIYSSILNKDKSEDTGTNNEETDNLQIEAEPKEPKDPYEELAKAQLRFPLSVKDDYGVKELKLKVDLDQMVEDKPLGQTFEETRLIMSQPNIDFKISPIFDLAWHTWAGLPVTFEFSVTDHKGQVTTLAPISMTLPERQFEHPMAQSLIAMRKRLAWDYTDTFIPIVKNLEALLQIPEYMQHNPVVYLAIRTASSRLMYVEDKEEIERIEASRDVIDLLWNAAIAVEDGNLALAMRELRDAQRELENAMRDPNSSDAEIAQLMDNLRQKMAEYFSELHREMQKNMADGKDFPSMSPDNFDQLISPETLAQLMEEIESALQSGDEHKAQELMSQLQRMMEMMDPNLSPQMPMDMQVMREGINELQELIERQEKLLEQTEEQARLKRILDGRESARPRSTPSIEQMLKDFGMDNMPPPPPTPLQPRPSSPDLSIDTLPNKTEQQALRYILGQLMMDTAEHLDEIPEAMGLAEQEMRGSEDALEQNDPTSSVPHQEQAIEYLKESQQQLSQQLKTRMQQMVGIGFNGAQSYDPLGRPYGGSEEEAEGKPHGSRVEIPDEAQRKRVDEILRTLRERSGDLNRPDYELDYFRRLLRQF